MNAQQLHQRTIPDGLSEERYISGIAALNLPAPEGTSGDWHFVSCFYTNQINDVPEVFIAGRDGRVDTNSIYGNYGIYDCTEALKTRGIEYKGKRRPYAANHFRAILDLLYDCIIDDVYPLYMQKAAEDFLDSDQEKNFLLAKAALMLPHLKANQQALLLQWIEQEKVPGYRS